MLLIATKINIVNHLVDRVDNLLIMHGNYNHNDGFGMLNSIKHDVCVFDDVFGIATPK